MGKGSLISILAFTSILAGASVTAQSVQMSATGYVTDTLAGKRGASPAYKDAAKQNVAAGMAKYALYDEKSKRLYILEPQSSAASYLGQFVTVSGTLAASPMQQAGQMVDPTSGAVKDFHPVVRDTTPIAGVLTITSIGPPPAPASN